LDNFNDYVSENTDGDDNYAPSLIQDTPSKFVDPHWYNKDTGETITGTKLTLVDIVKVATKWGPNQKPVEKIPIAPAEPWPDFKKKNAETPQSEWITKFGVLCGPWEGQQALYFCDENYNRFTWASSINTIGSSIAVREITDQIRFKGLVYAVCELGHTDFRTQVGMKQRPHLLNNITWVKLTEQNTVTLSAPEIVPEKIAAPAASSGSAPPGAQPVAEPTLKEELDDKVPW
jgi:hypothetical protein